MSKISISVVNKSFNNLPQYETAGAAGLDVRANLTTTSGDEMVEYSIILAPKERVLVPTGLFVAIPEGYEIQVRPRSGLAYKNGITVINSPGTIDSDYRGEIKVILINHSDEPFLIENGERIGQLVLSKVGQLSWNNVLFLDDTSRGAGGMGSTGK
jgi:dUTP pyrophosphatase